jgi:hypothetical protein
VSDDNGAAQLEVLRAIWNETKGLNARIDTTRTELKAELVTLRAELRAEDDALRRRLTESEIRVSTAVTELSGETRALASLIREWREEHRADRADLRERVDRIEQHLGIKPS